MFTAPLHCLLLGAFLLPYLAVNSWSFPLALPFVLLFARQLRGPDFLRWLGLKIPRLDLTLSLIFLILCAWTSREVLIHLAEENSITPDSTRWTGGLRLRPIFQVLSEEMLFRAILLGELVRRLRGFSTPGLNLMVCAAFGLLHIPFYLLKDGSFIGWMAAVNLGLFSWACNAFYLKRGHIGFAVALHLGWNWTRFGMDFTRAGELLAEGALFRTFEGSWQASALAAAAIAISVACPSRSAPQNAPK